MVAGMGPLDPHRQVRTSARGMSCGFAHQRRSTIRKSYLEAPQGVIFRWGVVL